MRLLRIETAIAFPWNHSSGRSAGWPEKKP
jgi:hypothetical protein